jgi:hypothetical protein
MEREFEKPYLDADEEFFEKLSEEEQERRIEETGSREGAIQQYSLDLAL